ncbi:major capsid protein [Xanthomonas virus PB119]|nr:major capsid protein [Xanthomonas virus PB119]
MPLNYNAPAEGDKSSIDGAGSDQMNTFVWLKKSIIESRRDQYFMPLANVTNMPKYFGKKIKVYYYVPLLDDRNINDQGIDANGVTIANGNLYGSSKDIGAITSKLPTLTENGGRVNRVGFTRLEREGSIHKFGFFYEWTQESTDFDSDDQLRDHLSRELMNGAVQLTEAVLQADLLSMAGTVFYAGAATNDGEVTGEEDATDPDAVIPASLVDYRLLSRLDQTLTDLRTPTQTTIITGSRLIDTKVLGATRVIYVGSELAPLLKTMRDPFGNKAFVEIQHYAAAGNVMNGEIGTIDAFRIIQVPEMLHWAAKGAVVGTNPGYRSSTNAAGEERYDIFPMLVVGDDAFTTIGFQTDGKTVKFSVITKTPGKETADRNDPFGETGFSSIKWYYGILIKRPERLGLIKTVAPI